MEKLEYLAMIESTREKCEKLANIAKAESKWREAAVNYENAANFSRTTNSSQAEHLSEAGLCYSKDNQFDKSIECFTKAANIFIEVGRSWKSSRIYEKLAELYEMKDKDLSYATQASEFYEKAARIYEGEDSIASRNKCLQKIAKFQLKLRNYEKARQYYENVGLSSLGNNLLKYGGRDTLVYACACRLAQRDYENVTNDIARYSEKDPKFLDCLLFEFFNKLFNATKNNDVQEFNKVCVEYAYVPNSSEIINIIRSEFV